MIRVKKAADQIAPQPRQEHLHTCCHRCEPTTVSIMYTIRPLWLTPRPTRSRRNSPSLEVDAEDADADEEDEDEAE
jgi:hypothetical protein